jgi:DNA-binding GntR family transcriptional regulator
MTPKLPIPRRVLSDEIASRLRDMIVAGDLKPGQKLNEAELALTFQVSRTPLREALKVMVAEGMIEITPHRGATVARLTAQEVAEIFPIMGIVEGLAAELACANMTPAALSHLEALHAEMLRHWQARGTTTKAWTAYSNANRAIHAAIFEIADNATLSAQYQQLMFRIHAVRFVARKSPEDWQRAVQDHEDIMAAFRSRDKARLFQLMRDHLTHKAGVVTAAIETQDGATDSGKIAPTARRKR